MINRPTEIGNKINKGSWIKENKLSVFLAGSAAAHTVGFLALSSETAFSLVACYGTVAIVPSLLLLALGKKVIDKLRHKPILLPAVEQHAKKQLADEKAALNDTAWDALVDYRYKKDSQINWGNFFPMAERVASLTRQQSLPDVDLKLEQQKWEAKLIKMQRQVEAKMPADDPLAMFAAALKYLDGTGKYRVGQPHLFKTLENGKYNCESRAKLYLAVLQRAFGNENSGWQLAVARYRDHLEVVLFNRRNSEAYHPDWGRTGVVPASIYDPRMFAAAYLKAQGEKIVNCEHLILKSRNGWGKAVPWLERIFNKLRSLSRTKLFDYGSAASAPNYGSLTTSLLMSIPVIGNLLRAIAPYGLITMVIVVLVKIFTPVSIHGDTEREKSDRSAETSPDPGAERKRPGEKELERVNAMMKDLPSRQVLLSSEGFARQVLKYFDEREAFARKYDGNRLTFDRRAYTAAVETLFTPEGTALIGDKYRWAAYQLEDLGGTYLRMDENGPLEERRRLYIEEMSTKYQESACGSTCPTASSNELLYRLLAAKKITLKEVKVEPAQDGGLVLEQIGRPPEPDSVIEVDIVNMPAASDQGLRPKKGVEQNKPDKPVSVDINFFISVLKHEGDVAASLLGRLSEDDLLALKNKLKTDADWNSAQSLPGDEAIGRLLDYPFLKPRFRTTIMQSRGVKKELIRFFNFIEQNKRYY